MKKRGFFVFGLAVGFLIGNSITSVSVIAVSSLLGFMGSVVSMIIIGKEKENDKKTSNNMDNLDTLGSIFGLLFMGMLIGNIFGAIFKKGIPVGSHIIQFDTSTQIPKQTSP
jgi:hypothetical protein